MSRHMAVSTVLYHSDALDYNLQSRNISDTYRMKSDLIKWAVKDQ